MSQDKMASGGAGEARASAGAGRAAMPVRYCAVYDCLNTYKTNPEISFFGFPHDKAKIKLWAQKIRRPDIVQEDGRVSSYYRVCETHFLQRHINPNLRRRRLLKKAVPCLRLPHAGPYVSVVEPAVSVVKPAVSVGKPAGSVGKPTVSVGKPAASVGKPAVSVGKPVVGVGKPVAPIVPLELPGRTLVRSTLEVFEYVDQTPKRKTKKQREDKNRKTSVQVTAPPALEGFFTDCDRYLVPSMAEFVKIVTQLRQEDDSRFNDLCLKLLHSNPPAYRLLQNTLGLPNVGTLHRQCAHLLPDFNSKLSDLLKTKVDRMKKKEKHCTLSVEFIGVRPNLYYNITLDRIVGLHEVDGAQNPWAATHGAVVTVRGLLVGWTQPVAVCFLARPDEAFDRWIEKIIRLLQAIGLVVHGLVWDPMAPNAAIDLKEKISPERPYFKVGDTKIHFVYDPPRLMKMLLCKFQAHDFYFEKMMASWSDVSNYRKIENHKPLTLTPGLTDTDMSHGAAWRMRPARAARLLSPALAAALSSYADRKLLPDTAHATIKLILKINNLYDILSSTTTRTSSEFKKGLGQDPTQIGYLEYMKSFFKSLKLGDEFGIDEVETKSLTDCWQITIEAVLALRKELEPIQPRLLTSRLHMDDRISETVRSRGSEPTCRQIFAAFKMHFFNDMLETPGGERSVDMNSLLAKIVSDAPTSSLDVRLAEKVRMSDYRHLRLPRRGAVAAAAKHLLGAALRVHGDCEQTRRYAAAPPAADFLQLVSRLDEALVSTLDSGGPARALVRELLLDLHVLDCALPCACFPLDHLKQLFLRLRLYRLLRHNQTRFKNTSGTDGVGFQVNALE